MHIVAAKAICFAEALSPDYKVYAQGVVDNAKGVGRNTDLCRLAVG